jgi:hypothetical protein
MTLVITEISDAGVAMVADSMILFENRSGGQLTNLPPVYQQKLFKIPQLVAGASYWGSIGLVVPDFVNWFRGRIALSQAKTLKEFADDLAFALNYECQHRALPKDRSMGIHLAGYSEWDDRTPRPTFFHIHNGDLHTEWSNDPKKGSIIAVDPTGESMPRVSLTDHNAALREALIEESRAGHLIYPTIKMEPRKLFEAHRDFPRANKSTADNVAELKQGYATKNGNHFRFSLKQQSDGLLHFPDIEGRFSYPGDPVHDVGGALHRIIDQFKNVMEDVRWTTETATYGGKLWKLGITEPGIYTACDSRL